MISKLKEGVKSTLEGFIAERRLLSAGDSKQSYYLIKIADSYGKELVSTVWDNNPAFKSIANFPKGYKVSVQVTLEDSASGIGFLHSIDAFKAKPIDDQGDVKARFKKTILEMSDKRLKRLIVSLLNFDWFADKFFTVPDAGYNITGGLVLKTFKLIGLSHENADYFERFDENLHMNLGTKMSRDLFITAIIFAQSAKAYLYEDDMKNLSLEKMLSNETQVALKLLDEAIVDIGAQHGIYFSNEQRLAIEHVISCAFVGNSPKTKEASLISNLYSMDSQMSKFNDNSSDVVVLNYLELASPPVVKINETKSVKQATTGDDYCSVNASNEFGE